MLMRASADCPAGTPKASGARGEVLEVNAHADIDRIHVTNSNSDVAGREAGEHLSI